MHVCMYICTCITVRQSPARHSEVTCKCKCKCTTALRSYGTLRCANVATLRVTLRGASVTLISAQCESAFSVAFVVLAVLGECSTLWGEREQGSMVGVYVSSHRKLIGHIGCCRSPQLLAFSAGRAHTG